MRMFLSKRHWCALILAIFSVCLLSTQTYAAASRSSIGVGWGIYSGSAINSIIPPFSPGLDFSAGWLVSKKLELVSKFELDTIFGGTTFGDTGSGYSGFALIYKFQPHVFLVTDSKFNPYFSAGPMIGAFGVLLTNVSPSMTAANNQASLKFGFTAGIGADYSSSKKGGGTKAGGLNVNLDYFYFTPTPSKFQFQAGKIEARGIRLTVSWYLESLGSKKKNK